MLAFIAIRSRSGSFEGVIMKVYAIGWRAS